MEESIDINYTPNEEVTEGINPSETTSITNKEIYDSIMLNNRLQLEGNLYLFLILLTIVATIAISCFYKFLKSIFKIDIK